MPQTHEFTDILLSAGHSHQFFHVFQGTGVDSLAVASIGAGLPQREVNELLEGVRGRLRVFALCVQARQVIEGFAEVVLEGVKGKRDRTEVETEKEGSARE